MLNQTETLQISRRAYLRNGSLFLLGAACSRWLSAADVGAAPRLRAGLVTDLHHADKPPKGTRFYRDTLAKLSEAVDYFTKQKPDFVVELGDLIDAADAVETEQQYLRVANEAFTRIPGPKHYVLGNHCVDTLTKEEFLGGVGKKESFYSFDANGVHFIVLDACFRSDGKPYGRKNSTWTDSNLPPHELDWLQKDLKAAQSPVIVFAHQRLDESKPHCVNNAPDVRKLLESSGKVLAVFQGHSHQNDYQEIAGIHYCTLVAMVEGAGLENSGYSMLNVFEDGTIELTGFRKQAKYRWEPAKAGR